MYLEAILAEVKLLEAEDGLCLTTSGSVLVCASLNRSEVQSANKVLFLLTTVFFIFYV